MYVFVGVSWWKGGRTYAMLAGTQYIYIYIYILIYFCMSSLRFVVGRGDVRDVGGNTAYICIYI